MKKTPLFSASLVLALGVFFFAQPTAALSTTLYSQSVGGGYVSGAITTVLTTTLPVTQTYTATVGGIQFVGGSIVVNTLKVDNTGNAYKICVGDNSGSAHFVSCSALFYGNATDTFTVAPFSTIEADGGVSIAGDQYQVYAVAATTTIPSNNRVSWDSGFALGQTSLWTAASVPIDFGLFQFPVVYSASSSALAASSSLWGAYASSSNILTSSCSTSNNPLDSNFYSGALCVGVAFLFVPDPHTLDEGTALANDAQTRVPFSWTIGLSQMYSISTASSSSNMISLVIDLRSVDPASSTPFRAFLPRWEVLSTTTILKYIGTERWAFYQLLMSGAIWLGLATMMFMEVRHKTHKV